MKRPAWNSLRAVAVGGIAVALLTLTGCVSERTAGNEKVFTYEWWVPTLMFVGGIAATAGGWFARGANDRWPYILLIGGPIAFIFMGPSYFLNKTTLGATDLKVRAGTWGMGTNLHVKYDDLQEVRFATTVSTGRRGRKSTNHFLDCKLKDNTDVRLPLSNDCIKAAAPEFIYMVRERNIPLYSEDGVQINLDQE